MTMRMVGQIKVLAEYVCESLTLTGVSLYLSTSLPLYLSTSLPLYISVSRLLGEYMHRS
jgi:hypothetical protein